VVFGSGPLRVRPITWVGDLVAISDMYARTSLGCNGSS
jgi:hypothetical protein